MPSDIAIELSDISPAEFERRKRDKSTTPTEDRKRCPECGSLDVRSRKPDDSRGPGAEIDAEFFCERCRSFIDTL